MPKQLALRSSLFFLSLAFGVACHDSVTAPSKQAPSLATNDVVDEVAIPPEGLPRDLGEGETPPALNLVPNVGFSLSNPGISFVITAPTANFTAVELQDALSSSAAPVSISSFTKFGATNQSALTNVARVGYPTDGSTYLIVSSGDARTPGVEANYFGCTSDAVFGTLCDVGGLNIPLQVPANATNLEFDYRYFAADYTPFEDPFRVFIVAGGVTTRVLQVHIATEFGTKPNNGLRYGPMRHAIIDVTAYRGQLITLRFQASDRSDTINAGGALIDNLTLGVANAAPAITAPPNLTFSTDPGVCVATVAEADLGTPTVTDDAPGYTVSLVRSDGAAFDAPYPRGTTTVIWTVTDAEGLTASASQFVTVNDTEPPAINSVPPVTVSTDPGQPYATVGSIAPSANDNCGDVTVTGPTGGQYPIGTTTLVWVATDGSGNESSTSTTITVLDLEPPVLSVPASFTVNATMTSGAVVTFAATATDNSGSVSVECSPTSGSVYGIGTTSTTCTATDPFGNETSKSFSVTVLGAADQLRDLIAFVESLNLHNGTENPLVNMARTALNHVAEIPPHVSCTKLDDFLRKLQEHKALQNISAANIARMEADAERIKNVLGCATLPS